MRSLLATPRLIGLTLRRDRVKIAVWVAALVGLVLWSTLEYETVYPTTADLRARADLIQGNAATVALTGPGYGLDHPTLGNVLTNDLLGMFAVAVALMGAFQVVRNTRAEEEDGRAELLAAGVVGRHARSAAALTSTLGACLLVGALSALMLIAAGLEPAGSFAFGLAAALCGTAFSALALLVAQLSRHARVATGATGAALGAAFALRAAGDIGSGTASWLSPIGWAQAVRPFADERWWPLLLLLAATVLLAAAAFAVEARRDLGSGMIADRPGPARASAALLRPGGLPLRQQRVAIVAWALGALAGGVVYGSIGSDVAGLLDENPSVSQYLAQTGGDPTDSYFVTVLLMIALIAAGFAIQSVLRLRGEETSGRAEAVLATALGRTRWAGGYAALTLLGSTLILLIGGVGLGLGYAVAGGSWSKLLPLAGAALAWLPGVLVLAGATGLLLGAAPRALPLIWALLAWCFFVGFFGQALNLPGWLSAISPLDHVPEVPAVTVTAAPLIALTAIALALSGAGLAALRRRDITA